MSPLQLLAALLVGGMIFGWPFALLIQRLARNDATYPEPREAATCLHPRSWLEVVGIEPAFATRIGVRLRCRLCGDDACLLAIHPHQGRENPPPNAANQLEVVHGPNLHDRPFAVLSEAQRIRQPAGFRSVRA